MILLLATAALVAVAALLLTEARYPQLEWLFKPLAALCFVALALNLDALDTVYGRWLLAGLLLCLLGDVLLIAKSDAAFLAGLASFLLGHLLYGVAFLTLPLNPTALLAGGVLA
ncbi:MAG: lysoplasmalogenase family protein, partial [Halieaceae bacterium]|nr:lysoplasmalogenase family protein [Halieaceae bacterium]